MNLIPVGRNKFAAVDKDVFDSVGDKFWCIDSSGYAVRNNEGENQRLHSYVMGIGASQYIDHINRNKLDCRRLNLRECTPRQNSLNKGPVKGKYKGVYKHSQYEKWAAQFSGKHLGVFDTDELAAKAYNDSCKKDKDYGFCYLNFSTTSIIESGFIPSDDDLVSVPAKGKSRYKGVTENASGWIARKTVNGVREYFGSHKTEEGAAKALGIAT